MSLNHQLGRKVALHQSFVRKLDDCKDVFEELSDMQAYRKLKDSIDEFIELKSKAGEINYDPLKSYLEEIVNAEILLLKVTREISRIRNAGNSSILKIKPIETGDSSPIIRKSKKDCIGVDLIK